MATMLGSPIVFIPSYKVGTWNYPYEHTSLSFNIKYLKEYAIQMLLFLVDLTPQLALKTSNWSTQVMIWR
jgi:hypothetical protein